MRYYVDCEFNGNGGQLLSIGITSQDGRTFYRVLPFYQLPHPWVAEHVLPWLDGTGAPCPATPVEQVRRELADFLNGPQHRGTHVFVADWPEDLEHLMHLLLKDHGKRYPPKSFVCLLVGLEGFNTAEHSTTPHHAGADSVALRNHVEQGLADGVDGALSRHDLRLLQSF